MPSIEELQAAQAALSVTQPHRGETLWRQWCCEWHASDPHLTASREAQLTRHVVDSLWRASDYGVSPRLLRIMMMAAKLAIRAHWPASITPPRPGRALC
jgi:hypothetical protein